MTSNGLYGVLIRLHVQTLFSKITMRLIDLLPLGKKIHTLRLKQSRFILRAIWYKKQINKLENNFDCDPLRPVIISYPKLYDKPFKPYLFCGLSVKQRFDYIISNYLYLKERFSDGFIQQLYVDSSINLCQFAFDDNKSFSVQLCYIAALGREGEVCISLLDEEQRRIYSLAFLFCKTNDHLQVIIGGIQGVNSTDIDKQKVIMKLTKNLHGLRPRSFLLVIVQFICDVLSVDKLSAVSTNIHISQCSHTKKGGGFKADYNVYWEEAGGKQVGQLYELPTTYEKRNLSEVKSNKRAMYIRRQNFLDQISISVANAIEAGFKPLSVVFSEE